MFKRLKGQVGKLPGEGDPARDLADIWGMLDVLPTASATTNMAATTVDLMAVRLSPRGSPAGPYGWFPLPGWIVPAAVIVGALVAGIVFGRITAADPLVANLPFIKHLDLLQEAGSLRFLEQLAKLMASERPAHPRWFRLAREPAAVRAEAREFDDEVEALRQDFTAQSSSTRAAQLPAAKSDRLERIEKSAETFFSLSPIDRREVEAVARALADPSHDHLRDAARLWHVIVAATPLPLRRSVIEMRLDDRLEWLQRPVGGEGRFNPRAGDRGREDDRRSGPRRGDGEELRPGLRSPGSISQPGLPPRVGPPTAPAETPAPLR